VKTNDRMKNGLRLPAFIASAALMSSCISHNHSAGDWVLPGALPDGVCPDISGQYANAGQSADSKEPAYLYCELFSSKTGPCSITQAKQIDRISIEKADAGLVVSAWGGGSTVASVHLALNEDAYLCKDGWITVKSNAARGYSSSAAEFSATTKSFAISQGHLLEKKRTEGVLFLFILPIAGSTTLWYRYPTAEGPNNSLQGRRP
jgi:hypothetical protein